MDATCTINAAGNLVLTADEETREELRERGEDIGDDVSILCDLLESYACNGSYTPFDAGKANPFVGLTSAPCIAETLNFCDESEEWKIDGRFWAYMDYQITSPVAILRDEGEVIFTLAG